MTVPVAPRLSVVVCTRDRPEQLRRALASVHRAAAALPDLSLELIVVDDGDRPLAPIAAETGTIRLLRAAGRGVGAARAAGLDAVRGALVAYCDDDDEWTSDHLVVLVAALGTDPDLALVHGDGEWGTSEREATPTPRPPALGWAEAVHASDVRHRARAARDVGGFDPTLPAYEDIDRWLRLDEAYRRLHLSRVVARHGRGADAITASDHPAARERLHRWHERPRPCRASDPGPRPGRRFDPTTWQAGLRQLRWRSPLNPYQGFGAAARELLLATERAGIEVGLLDPPGPAAPELERFRRGWDERGRITLSHEYWHPSAPIPAEPLVVATMHEGTLVPPAQINAVNRDAALVYVPCRQNQESFIAAGLRVPIKTLPFGVDPVRFPLLARPRPAGAPVVFGTFGVLSARKGIDVLVRAFLAEFAADEPVRLRLKSLGDPAFPLPVDPRLEVVTGFHSQVDLLSFLAGLDVFVLPSRAEGFGLGGLEAMATGLPLIATAWSGPADYLDPADGFPLRSDLVPAAGTEANGVRYFGEWAEPDEAHLRALMRWVCDHQADAAAMGPRAAARVHRDWTWDRPARQLRADLDLLAAGVSPT